MDVLMLLPVNYGRAVVTSKVCNMTLACCNDWFGVKQFERGMYVSYYYGYIEYAISTGGQHMALNYEEQNMEIKTRSVLNGVIRLHEDIVDKDIWSLVYDCPTNVLCFVLYQRRLISAWWWSTASEACIVQEEQDCSFIEHDLWMMPCCTWFPISPNSGCAASA